MKTFKTPKGTELPFADIKGKQYLLVPHRLVWFREEHPKHQITIDCIDQTEAYVTCKATIRDESGLILQQAHKTEHFAHFADALEKCETGAVGRALAMLGYGTAFAQELESPEDKVVDSPLIAAAKETIKIANDLVAPQRTVQIPPKTPLKPLDPLMTCEKCGGKLTKSKKPGGKPYCYLCYKSWKDKQDKEDNIPY